MKRATLATIEDAGTVCPAQWDGTLSDGACFYIRYRSGRLRIYFGNGTAPLDNPPMVDEVLNPGNRYDGDIEWAQVKPHFEHALHLYNSLGANRGDSLATS